MYFCAQKSVDRENNWSNYSSINNYNDVDTMIVTLIIIPYVFKQCHLSFHTSNILYL